MRVFNASAHLLLAGHDAGLLSVRASVSLMPLASKTK